MRWFLLFVPLFLFVLLFADEVKLAFKAKEGDKQVWEVKSTIEYETDFAGQKQKITETLEGEAELTCQKGDDELLCYNLKPLKFKYVKDDGKKKQEVSSEKEPPQDDWFLPLLKGKIESELRGIAPSPHQLKVGGAFDGKGLALTVASIWLPDTSVKEGQTWTGQTELALPGLALATKLTWEYKLLGNDGKTVRIEGVVKKAEIAMKMEGYKLKVEGKLTAKIELKDMHIKEVASKMTWDFSYTKGKSSMAGKGVWKEEVKAK